MYFLLDDLFARNTPARYFRTDMKSHLAFQPETNALTPTGGFSVGERELGIN
jgi:hypothetical protein